MKPTDVFDTDETGNAIVKSMVGYSTMPVAGMFVLTRLEYADSDAHLMGVMSGETKPWALQLAITPAQAHELGARLIVLADHILTQQTPDGSSKN
ncbi:hypothetical protein [Profundibacter sp.]